MILITGSQGQLGTELRFLLDERKIDYVATGVAEMDITDQAKVEAKFTQVKPAIIFHVAAYTNAEKSEDEERTLAYQINVEGTKNIAKAAEKIGATLFYISTDYVFDGKLENGEYQPTSATNPLNEYGRTKLLGEKAVVKFSTKYYIIRTSWIFGKYGNNFVFTMQRLANNNAPISVVNDQLGRPTWSRTLAEFMVYLTERGEKIPFGIYHLSNDDTATWYSFAKKILKNSKVELNPITSNQFPQKARRPLYSVMSLEKTKNTGFLIPTWQEVLAKMLAEKN